MLRAHGDDAVPLLADTQGIRGALLLVDEVTGHVIIEAIWRPAAATYGPAWPSRHGWVTRTPEESGLVFNPGREA